MIQNPNIGKPAVLTLDGLKVPVIVQGARAMFGRIDYLVLPQGSQDNPQWFSQAKLSFPVTKPN